MITADQTEHEKKKQEIVREALILFGTKGLTGTSLEEIMGKVNLGKTAFYNYYDNKESLFASVLETSHVNLLMHKLRVEVSAQSCDELLKEVGRAYFAMADDPTRPAIFKTTLQQSYINPKIGRVYYEKGKGAVAKDMADYLEVFHQRGEIRDGIDLHLAAELFIIMVWGYNILYKDIKGITPKHSEEEVLNVMTEIFLKGIMPLDTAV